VNRHVLLEGTVADGETDLEVDSISPSSGSVIRTVGFYVGAAAGVELSYSLEETKLMDNVPGDELPGSTDPVRFEVVLDEGDELRLLASNSSGAAVDVRVVVLVEDTGKDTQ
jgi:hypothetical protein